MREIFHRYCVIDEIELGRNTFSFHRGHYYMRGITIRDNPDTRAMSFPLKPFNTYET